MSGLPIKIYWEGKDVEDMPKEKHLEIIRFLYDDVMRLEKEQKLRMRKVFDGLNYIKAK